MSRDLSKVFENGMYLRYLLLLTRLNFEVSLLQRRFEGKKGKNIAKKVSFNEFISSELTKYD